MSFTKAQMEGTVVDTNQNPLIGATVLLLPDSIYTTSGTDGHFTFEDISAGPHQIKVSYIGYLTSNVQLAMEDKSILVILESSPEVLETIVVTEEHVKQEETLQTEHVHETFFEKNIEGTFAQSLEKLAGISSINVGVGIAKPVIRGLSSNRIIVNHQGIKQESQQWGSDHGLEIDQFDVKRVEIVKGPGSLQYGSDGMGGVINIMPDPLLPKNSYKGELIGIYKSNNDHVGGSAQIGLNKNDCFVTARYSIQAFGDYHVPANSFVYNGFTLPILNNTLKNTAGEESNIALTAGVSRDWGITRVLYNHYSLKAGLFSGAVGIPRSYALTDDGNSRDIDVPSQEVDHQRFSVNQTFFFGQDHLVFDLGYQRNHRRENSQPEFHSIPLSQLKDPNNKLAVELILETYSLATHYEHSFLDDWKHTLGSSVQWQYNTRGGFEHLLPNFNTFRGGLFSIVEKQWTPKLLINGGVRLDLAKNTTQFYKQYVWNSNETIVDSLTSPMTDDRFFNWSASLGGNLSILNDKWTLKANLGKSFRVPYPSETVSNGIHHGTFRHELGTPDLRSEHGYQFDIGAYFDNEKIKGSVASYFNYFDNYIYLGPAFPARFSRLPEAGQIYQYRQDDAIYTGFEIQWNWSITPNIEFEQAMDYVQSYNLKTQLALPFSPQPSIKNGLTYQFEDWKILRETYVNIFHEYHMAAKGFYRIDRSEKPTPAYQLIDLGMGTHLQIGRQEVNISLQVKNLLDTKYLNHLSRYRIINVPEQGRNIVVSCKVPMVGKL